MRQPIPEEFKEKFDDLLSEIHAKDSQISALNREVKWALHKKHPDEFYFDFTGGWAICVLVSCIVAAIVVTFENKGLLFLSLIANFIVFLFIRNSQKESQLTTYKHQCDLWHEKKKIYDIQIEERKSAYRKLRKFLLNLYVWIKSNRENINISSNQLRRLSYYHNQYLDKKGKYYDSEDWLDQVDYVSGTMYDILFDDENIDLKTQNEDYDEKVAAYLQKERETILSKNSWITDDRDKKAARTVAKLRTHSVDVIQRITGVSEAQAEDIANNIEIQETKKVANHIQYEGRISIANKNKVKSILGAKCMACGKDMSEIYGDIGKNYIELHHKIPYSDMKENDTRTLSLDDFCVLCPDCHRMIHRLPDAGDIDMLARIIKINGIK